MKILIARDPQKLHRTLDHADGGIAVSAHDSITQRAMIGTDAHSRPVFFANADQRGEAFADAIDLLGVFGIGVFELFKFFLVDVITRIHAHFLDDAGCDLGGIGRKMNVGYKRCVVPALAEFILDVLEIFCLFFGWSSNTYEFGTRLNAANGLLHRCEGIHRIGGGHGLHANRIAVTQPKMPYANRERFQSAVAGQRIGIVVQVGHAVKLSFPFAESKLIQDAGQDLHPNARHFDIPISRLQIQYKEIGMIVLFDPTHNPSQGMPLFGKAQTGFITQAVFGIAFPEHGALDCFLVGFIEGKLIEVQAFYST